MADTTRPRPETRDRFLWHDRLPTRWNDNDPYGHVSNSVYYGFFDTAITRMQIARIGFDLARSPVIGLVVESGCRYFASFAFPDEIGVSLRIGALGRSSVRYELGLFKEGATEASAQGHFVQVMVDRADNRPVPIPPEMRAVLETLMLPPA